MPSLPVQLCPLFLLPTHFLSPSLSCSLPLCLALARSPSLLSRVSALCVYVCLNALIMGDVE